MEIFYNTPERLHGRNMLGISDDEFCHDPVAHVLIITLSSFSGSIVQILLVGLIVYRFRVKFYVELNIHHFDRDECEGKNQWNLMDFSASHQKI